MLEIIGFIAVIATCLWMVGAGFFGWLAVRGLTGSSDYRLVVLAVIGVLLLITALYFSPFTVQFIER